MDHQIEHDVDVGRRAGKGPMRCASMKRCGASGARLAERRIEALDVADLQECPRRSLARSARGLLERRGHRLLDQHVEAGFERRRQVSLLVRAGRPRHDRGVGVAKRDGGVGRRARAELGRRTGSARRDRVGDAGPSASRPPRARRACAPSGARLCSMWPASIHADPEAASRGVPLPRFGRAPSKRDAVSIGERRERARRSSTSVAPASKASRPALAFDQRLEGASGPSD